MITFVPGLILNNFNFRLLFERNYLELDGAQKYHLEAQFSL